MCVQGKVAKRLQAYTQLCCYPRQIGTVLLVIRYYWGVLLYTPSLATAAGYSVPLTYGGFMARSAGCALNDFCDWPFGIGVWRSPPRPLATAEVSLAEAVAAATPHATLGSLIFFALPSESPELH